MESSEGIPVYYNLILLIVFGLLFFYFLYELMQQEQPFMDAAIMLVCGGLAIRNYVRWKQKLQRHIN